MKYSEFEKDIEAMGYSIVNGKGDIYVEKRGHSYLISVGLRSTYTINSDYKLFRNLEDLEKERLFNLAWQLASTPLKDREDEKKYRLRIPFMNDVGYLNIGEENGNYYLTTKLESDYFRTTFTESEIEELKAEHNLDSFVVEEVKEDV